MKHTLTALLSAASICAFAGIAPASAQAFYGQPYGQYPAGGPTKGQSVVPPQISYSLPSYEQRAQPGVTGSCQMLDGNRVCTAAPANGYGYGYGYGYGAQGGLLGAAVGAPLAAAGALAAVPFQAAGATAGALTGAPYPAGAPYPVAYAGAPMGTYPAGGPTVGQSVVPPQISYSLPSYEQTARPGAVGSCSLIAGNRVCSGAPAIP